MEKNDQTDHVCVVVLVVTVRLVDVVKEVVVEDYYAKPSTTAAAVF